MAKLIERNAEKQYAIWKVDLSMNLYLVVPFDPRRLDWPKPAHLFNSLREAREWAEANMKEHMGVTQVNPWRLGAAGKEKALSPVERTRLEERKASSARKSRATRLARVGLEASSSPRG